MWWLLHSVRYTLNHAAVERCSATEAVCSGLSTTGHASWHNSAYKPRHDRRLERILHIMKTLILGLWRRLPGGLGSVCSVLRSTTTCRILAVCHSERSRLCYSVASVCRRLSSVTLCIVAKRCVLEQKLLLRAQKKISPKSGRGLSHVTPKIFGIWSNISPKLLELETSNLVHGFVWRMTSRRTKISPKTGRGLSHVTPTIF